MIIDNKLSHRSHFHILQRLLTMITASGKRRYPVRLIAILLPVLLVFFIITYLPLPQPQLPIPDSRLPPRLDILTQHHKRPTTLPLARPEWKRPRVLTAHAIRTPGESSLNLAVFSTGTDTQSYGRKFKVVGCMIGDHVYRLAMSRPEVTICDIDVRPKKNDIITILLSVDERLKNAMNEIEVSSREEFELKDGDVTILNRTVNSNIDEDGLNEIASVASDLKWNDNLIEIVDNSRPRHEVCLMTAMKQYPYLLNGYAEYYKQIGVDQIFIYDNFAETDIKKHMQAYEYVQVIFWPWTRSQMQSFTHFLRASRARCKYVAFFDADEFIMIGDDSTSKNNRNGKDLMRRYIKHRMEGKQHYKQVITHFVRFLNDGYIKKPKGNLPELYTRREKDQRIVLGKAIIDTDHRFNFHKIHRAEGIPGTKTYWNTSLELNPLSFHDNAMLMHYTDRSWEENVLKNKFGGSSPMTSYRKPVELSVDKPEESYMDQSKSIPFTGFMKRYQNIMKHAKSGTETLVWMEEKKSCSSRLQRSRRGRRYTFSEKQCR